MSDIFGPTPCKSSAKSSRRSSSASKSGPPILSALSENASLSERVAFRLKQRTDQLGSTMYRLNWKLRVTPSGQSVFQLVASVRPTSGKGSTSVESASGELLTSPLSLLGLPPAEEAGWPTATQQDSVRCPSIEATTPNITLNHAVNLAGWPTCTSKESAGGEYSDPEKAMARATGPHANDLRDFAQMAGWTTPQAHDSTGRSASQKDLHGTKHGCACLGLDAQLSGWATPDAQAMNDGEQLDTWDARQAKNKAKHGNGNGAGMPIAIQCQLSGWATPVVQQANGTPEAFLRRKKESMERGSQSMGLCLSDLNMQVQAYLPGPARLTASGELLTGSSAGMISGGRLSPAMSLWLMMGPLWKQWLTCAERVSLPKKVRRKA